MIVKPEPKKPVAPPIVLPRPIVPPKPVIPPPHKPEPPRKPPPKPIHKEPYHREPPIVSPPHQEPKPVSHGVVRNFGGPAPKTIAGPGMPRLAQKFAVDRGRDLDPSALHVIVPYYNPFRWSSRKALHEAFMVWLESFGTHIYVVELTLGDCPHEVTTPNLGNGDREVHLQLTTSGPVPWVKENLINLGISKLLPADAKYVCWMDGDIRLENPNWPTDTLHELQHAKVVQMFSEAIDVGPNYELVHQENSMNDMIRRGIVKHFMEFADPQNPTDEDKRIIHCGFAWAARREFLAQLDPYDPLIDFSFIGSADWQMAWGFLGNMAYGTHGGVSDSMKRRLTEFGRKCEKYLNLDIGYVPGFLRHNWHGFKNDRQYVSRYDLLTKTGFDPDLDLHYDQYGLLYVTDRNPKLHLLLKHYGRSRNEDAV